MAKLSFAELFEIEIEGWRYGIEQNITDLSPKVIFEILNEMEQVFTTSIENHYAFDLVSIATGFSKASRQLVKEKEVAFYILSTLPHPKNFNEKQKKVLAKIIDQAEKQYGGAKERLKKRWAGEKHEN